MNLICVDWIIQMGPLLLRKFIVLCLIMIRKKFARLEKVLASSDPGKCDQKMEFKR